MPDRALGSALGAALPAKWIGTETNLVRTNVLRRFAIGLGREEIRAGRVPKALVDLILGESGSTRAGLRAWLVSLHAPGLGAFVGPASDNDWIGDLVRGLHDHVLPYLERHKVDQIEPSGPRSCREILQKAVLRRQEAARSAMQAAVDALPWTACEWPKFGKGIYGSARGFRGVLKEPQVEWQLAWERRVRRQLGELAARHHVVAPMTGALLAHLDPELALDVRKWSVGLDEHLLRGPRAVVRRAAVRWIVSQASYAQLDRYTMLPEDAHEFLAIASASWSDARGALVDATRMWKPEVRSRLRREVATLGLPADKRTLRAVLEAHPDMVDARSALVQLAIVDGGPTARYTCGRCGGGQQSFATMVEEHAACGPENLLWNG